MSSTQARRTNSGRNRIEGLLRRSGRCEADHVLENLEARVLLGGDHPSFMLPPSVDESTPITLNANGVGTDTGVIDPAGDDDVFSFVAPKKDFVTIWADTINTPSALDSRVEVYDSKGMLVAQGSTNGKPTGGLFDDGYASFVSKAGETYFVRVMSDKLMGDGSTGAYIIRVDAVTNALTLGVNGAAQATGSIQTPGLDRVFSFTTGSAEAFESLISATGQTGPTGLDTRVELYGADGKLIVADSQSGRLTNPFAVWEGGQQKTFYLRVRGDEFMPGDAFSTGAFAVGVATQATPIALDPVTRLGKASGQAGSNTTALYSFVAQGTGLTVIEGTGTGVPSLTDAALTLYDSKGVKVAFNDDAAGTSPIIQTKLDGGETYYLVVDGFNVGAAGGFSVWVESNTTLVTNPNYPTDDHVNTPTFDEDDTEQVRQARAELFNATPIILGNLGAATGSFNSLTLAALDFLTGQPLADHSGIYFGSAHGRLNDPTDTDVFQITAPVNMLGSFAGKEDDESDPLVWQPDHRPATRLNIQVLTAFAIDGSQAPFSNTQIRVLDSNLEVVYDTNTQVFNPALIFNDPSGMVDPASLPPDLNIPDHGIELSGDVIGIPVWGGETYFIEVRSENGGAARYNVRTFTDAMPGEDGTGDHIDNATGNNLHSTHQETADAGEWANASKIALTPGTGDGNSTLFGGGTISLGLPGSIDAAHERAWAINGANVNAGFLLDPVATANGGIAILQETGLPVIETIDDTDLYFFTAVADGTVELRIGTTDLPTAMGEIIIDGEDDPANPSITQNTVAKTISSFLDARVKVFNNDFELVASNDDNPAMRGSTESTFPGAFPNFEFARRDPRVVFNVQAGEKFFVQVESSQLARWQAALKSGDFSQVDWRGATGVYDIFINGTEDIAGDDHNDNVAGRSTMIPIVNATGAGLTGGIIQNNQDNPEDLDQFEFIAVGQGLVTLKVSAEAGSNMAPTVRVLDDANFNLVTEGTGPAGGEVELSFAVKQGERFFISVSSATNGAYSVEIDSPAFVDDHEGLGFPQLDQATTLEVLDFLGMASGTGSIENPGDADLFRFDANGYSFATVTVTNSDPALDPQVEVFEVSEDFAGNPVLLRVAFAFDATDSDKATISFPVSPNRTSVNSGINFTTYYVLVSGDDPDADAGAYSIDLALAKTDDHPDVGQFAFATPVIVPGATGQGASAGVLEVDGDTDLFQFAAPAGGFASLKVSSADGLNPTVQVLQVDGAGNQTVIAGDSDTGGLGEVDVSFMVVRGATYFVLVGGEATQTTTGSFDVALNAPTADDHPNITEFAIATQVNLAKPTGNGLDTGEIATTGDTDLFMFDVLAAGEVKISVGTEASALVPSVSVFDAAHVLVLKATDGGKGDLDGKADGAVTVALDASAEGERFFALVEGAGAGPLGAYSLAVDGAPAAQDPDNPDDHANAGDFDHATPISLSALNGNGTADGVINDDEDTDLFTFVSLSGGKAFLHVETEAGLNARVRVFGPGMELVASDEVGMPGVSASVSFAIGGPGEQYFVEVEGVGGSTGAYRIKVDTEPQTHFQFFPEGFANDHIDEFVSVFNPNDFAVTYSIVLRYENANLPVDETIVAKQVVLGAGMRGGATISQGSKGFLAPGVIKNTPYSIIVTSDGPVGASLSHYDFDVATGESFTDITSDTWTFARAERVPGAVRDFLVFFNPNDHQARVSLSARGSNGAEVVLTQIVGANRRSGWDLGALDELPNGVFGVVVTSEAVNPNDADEHIGIVASLTHYDVPTGEGFATLGDPNAGSTAGVIPSLSNGSQVQGELVFFNATDTPAMVTVTGNYINVNLPDVVLTRVIGAGQTVRIAGAQLGLVADQGVGMTYVSSVPLTVQGTEVRDGDANASGAISELGQAFFFGDAFMNTAKAGLKYFETLSLYNPASTSIEVTLTFSFSTGAQSEVTVSVGAGDFAQVALHTLDEILGQAGNLHYFGIEASSESPFATTLTHYDLFLHGGWTSSGAPLGITTGLASILG
jgi:hypothetical protein